MKKILSVLLATFMLASLLAIMAVPASAEGAAFYVNAWDPAEFVQGTAAIYTTTDCDEAWACHAAFAPTNEANVWKLVDYATSGDADGDGQQGDGHALAVPQGGFVWTVIWQEDNEKINTAMQTINSLNGCVGKTYKITGLDLANKTCADDANIEVVLGKDEFYATVINPTSPIGVEGVIYIGTNTNNGWWTQVAFKPVEGKTDVYQAVEVIWADGTKANIPDGGFVWAIHSNCLISSVREQIKNIGESIANEETDDLYVIKGIDVANKTIKNPTLKAYVEGEEVPPVEDETSETPVVSTPEESEGETTTPSTPSTPSTGDSSSMIIFAVIALAAMAGCVVVIKNRK